MQYISRVEAFILTRPTTIKVGDQEYEGDCGDYLVIDKDDMYIMSKEDFEKEFETDVVVPQFTFTTPWTNSDRWYEYKPNTPSTPKWEVIC